MLNARWFGFVALTTLLVACGASPGTEDPTAPAPTSTDVTPPSSDEPAPSQSIAPTGPTPAQSSVAKEVRGTVVDASRKPASACEVLLIDANGKQTVVSTDANGTFTIPTVVAPYDLRVSPPQSAGGYPIVFFGLTSPAPWIEHPAAAARAVVSSHKATINATVQLPTCPSGYCSVQLWSGSTNGYGRMGSSFMGAAHAISVTGDHEWTGNSTSESVTIDVLVNDASFTTFWHAKLASYTVLENASLNLGTITPQAVPRFGPITIQVTEPTIPADWRKDMQVFMDVPGQKAPFYMQRVASGSLVTYLPNVPGGTFSVSSWRNAKDVVDPSTALHVHSQFNTAVSKQLPLSATSVDLENTKEPTILKPTPLGTFTRNDQFEWEATPGVLKQFSLWDMATSKNVLTAFTSSNAVAYKSIERLGIMLTAGRHNIELMTQRGQSIDAVVDAKGQWAPWYGSTSTYEAVIFDTVQ